MDVRAGYAYNKGGNPTADVPPPTVDCNKITGGFAGSLYIGDHWRFDGVFALVLPADVDVSPAEAKIPRVNPVKGNPTKNEAINGGLYSSRATVLGAGLQYRF